MTKIQIDDGKGTAASKKTPDASRKSTDASKKSPKAVKKSLKASKKSPAKKITVTQKDPRKTPAEPQTQSKKTRKIPINAVASSSTHNNLQKSTTLSRRYVRRPISVVQQQEAEAARQAKIAAEQSALQRETEVRVAQKAAKPLKKGKNPDRALKSAARAAAVVDTPKDNTSKQNLTLEHQFKKKHHGRRIVLAIACSAATVSALVAFVHFNMPDISVRVAAMQTGIEASYPTFIPRNYSLSNVTSDKDGIIVMNFEGPDGAKFTLTEEKSTWDSTALLNNYVKKNYPSDFTTMREQGITIYTRGLSASWVNGGILYKIEASGKNLTKEQIRNIATSL